MAVWSIAGASDTMLQRRIDSEFFHPAYLNAEKQVRRVVHSNLGSLGYFVPGPFGSSFKVQNYIESKYRYIRGRDVKPFFLLDDDNRYIPEKDFTRLNNYAVSPNDLMISVVGTLGNVAVVTEKEAPAIFSCKSTLFRSLGVDPFYLLAFLNCHYGKLCMIRRQRGAVQGGLNIEDLKSIPIPRFDAPNESKIGEFIRKSCILSEESKSLYQQAQQLLESELDLKKLVFEKPIGYTTSFSDVVTTNRTDAQCFRPDYRVFPDAFKRSGNYNRLGSLVVMLKGKQMNERSEGSLRYGSIKDVDLFEFNTEGYCLPEKGTRIAGKHDLLLAITGATIGKIGIVERYESLAFSGDLLALKRIGEIDPFYLLAVMLSPAGQNQCQRWITGSTNGHLAPSDVAKIIIPRLNETKESSIAEMLRGSLSKKHESEALLKQAKTRVEKLIEDAITS